MTTKIAIHDKLKVDPNFPDDIKSDRWKLLLFMKSGRSVSTCGVHETEEKAHARGLICEKLIREDPLGLWQGEDGIFSSPEYSHFIPVPRKP